MFTGTVPEFGKQISHYSVNVLVWEIGIHVKDDTEYGSLSFTQDLIPRTHDSSVEN